MSPLFRTFTKEEIHITYFTNKCIKILFMSDVTDLAVYLVFGLPQCVIRKTQLGKTRGMHPCVVSFPAGDGGWLTRQQQYICVSTASSLLLAVS